MLSYRLDLVTTVSGKLMHVLQSEREPPQAPWLGRFWLIQ